MTLITRSWLSFAAFGAGIVHLALVVSSPLPIGLILLVLGLSEIVWGVLILAKDRVLVPRLAQAGAISPLILWSLVTVASTLLNNAALGSSMRFVPMAIASVFNLFIAGVLTAYLRRLADPDRAARKVKPATTLRFVSAIVVAGFLVAGLTTPALAATQAGTVAKQHGGTMNGMMMMDMPGH